jgi:hypothetical protein
MTDVAAQGSPQGAGAVPVAGPRSPSGPDQEAQLVDLLDGYERILAAIEELHPVVLVCSRSLLRVPRPRWLLRFFAVDHIDRTLQALCRRYAARAALRLSNGGEEADYLAARSYRESLPPLRRRTYAVLAAIAAVAGASIILPRATGLFAVSASPVRIRQFISAVESQAENPVAVHDLLDQLGSADAEVLTYVLFGLLAILYVLVRPLSAVFRVKRMIFDLYPDLPGLRSLPLSLSVRRATGLYELEDRVLGQVGARRPPEPPYDLLVSGLPMPLVVTLSVADLGSGDPFWTVFALLVLVLVAARIGWLLRTWRLRASSQPGSLREVTVATTSRRAVARWALILGALSTLLAPAISFAAVAGAVPSLLLARWSDPASTYAAGGYHNRRTTLAAKLLAWTAIVLGLAIALWRGDITVSST